MWPWGALLIWNWQFSTKIGEIEAHSFFANLPFPTKMCEILTWPDPTPLAPPLTSDHFWRKLVILRHILNLKMSYFRRKLAKLRRTLLLQIDNFRRNWVKIWPDPTRHPSLLFWKLTIFYELSKAPAEEAERFARAQWRVFQTQKTKSYHWARAMRSASSAGALLSS